MNKTELVTATAKKVETSKKDAEIILKAFTEAAKQELVKEGKIQFVGFGIFEISKRSACEDKDPRTGGSMKIVAAKTPKFKVGKALKNAVSA